MIKSASHLSASGGSSASSNRQLTQFDETLSLICISAGLITFSAIKDKCDEDDATAAAKTVCLCACQCGYVCALVLLCCHGTAAVVAIPFCAALSYVWLHLVFAFVWTLLSTLSRAPAPLVLFAVFSLIVAHNALTL